MKNIWKKVWDSRALPVGKSIELIDLIKINGFDTGAGKIELEDWRTYAYNIVKKIGLNDGDSLYEVGCGSGALMYALKEKKELILGGLDYASNLIEVAQKIMPTADLECKEASQLDVEIKYDYVISNSVFQYLNLLYARNVVISMIKKSKKSVYIFEIPDINKKKEAESTRKDSIGIKEYEEKYSDYEHTFYDQDWFYKIAKEENCSLEIFDGLVPNYKQNSYRFGCAIVKK